MHNIDEKLIKRFLYFFWILLFFTITTNARPWCSSSHLNETEQTICNNTLLRQLDTKLANVYGKAKAEKQDYDQLFWLKDIRNACGTSVTCLKREYRSRIRVLQNRIGNSSSLNDSSLRKYDASDIVGVPSTMVEVGNGRASQCKLAISNDGKYFFLTKVNSRCKRLTNSKGVKIICNPDKTLCKTRNELIRYIGANERHQSQDKHSDTVKAEFDYKIVGQKIYLDVDIYNYYKRYNRGGLSISFPQFSNRSKITVLGSSGFESVNKYPQYSRIYNKNTRDEMQAKYLLIEGWSDHWNDSYRRSVRLVIDTGYLDELIVNIRGVVRNKYNTVHIPTSGPSDQQGYHTKRIVINLEKSSSNKRDNISTRHVNAYRGECSDSNKPVLACSPDERDQKAFTMCAVTMGGCEVAVQQLQDANERYLASQACSALSSELMGQKYTLDDMLGTFFIDGMGELAKDQLKSDNILSKGFGLILAVSTVAGKLAQLEQCQINAKSHCIREYNKWQRNCN